MELEKHITDEKTGISYTLCGDYYLDDFELRLIIRALAEWRNALIAENKQTEDLDELLTRFCKRPLTTEYGNRKHLFSGNYPTRK